LSQPLVEEGFELRVERHVAVAVELADRHPKPVAEPICTTASTVRSTNSPRRKPVRASSSTHSRTNGSVSTEDRLVPRKVQRLMAA
jgi:hypothetical protein